MGTVLQAGQGMIPSRQAQYEGRDPGRGQLGDDQQGLRVGDARGHAARHRDPRRRPRGRRSAAAWSRCRNAPYLLDGVRFGLRLGDGRARDAMLQRRPAEPLERQAHGAEATEVAAELEITRAEMDRWAVRSHERAVAAIDDGRHGRGDRRRDRARRARSRRSSSSTRRRDATRRSRGSPSCRAIFVEDGSHTAGNSPGVNDGAGAIVVAQRGLGEAPTAASRWRRSSRTRQAADDFPYLARTPALAARVALAKAGLAGRPTSTSGRSTRRSPRS